MPTRPVFIGLLLALMVWMLTRDREEAADKATGKSRLAEVGASVRSGEDTSRGTGGMLPGKSGRRLHRPRLSTEKIAELLDRPIPGETAFPRENIIERIDRLNDAARAAGSPFNELRFVFHPSAAHLSQIVMPALHLRQSSFQNILVHTFSATKFDIRLAEGRVEIIATGFVDPVDKTDQEFEAKDK